MNLSVNDLLAIIGEQSVQLRVFQEQIQQLQKQLEESQKSVAISAEPVAGDTEK